MTWAKLISPCWGAGAQSPGDAAQQCWLQLRLECTPPTIGMVQHILSVTPISPSQQTGLWIWGLWLCLSCSRALLLKTWKTTQLLNEDGRQLLSSSGEGNGQEDAKGNPAPLQGSKKHHYSPHSKLLVETKFLWPCHHQQRWHQSKPNKVNKQTPQLCRARAPQHCSVSCTGDRRAIHRWTKWQRTLDLYFKTTNSKTSTVRWVINTYLAYQKQTSFA